MRVVNVDDVLPSVVGDDIENGLVVFGAQTEGVVHQTRSGHGHLFGEPGTEERHVVRIGVRVDGAERIGADGSQQSEDTPRQLRANYTRVEKKVSVLLFLLHQRLTTWLHSIENKSKRKLEE